MASRNKLLRQQLHERILRKGYSPRTEKAYAHWIRRFIVFNDKRHPSDLDESHINSFLSRLAVESSGLRLIECCRLRVKDVNLDYAEIVIRAGKGGNDRRTMLARRLIPAVRRQWWYLFPASRIVRDPDSGELLRQHLHETALRKAILPCAERRGSRCRQSGGPPRRARHAALDRHLSIFERFFPKIDLDRLAQAVGEKGIRPIDLLGFGLARRFDDP